MRYLSGEILSRFYGKLCGSQTPCISTLPSWVICKKKRFSFRYNGFSLFCYWNKYICIIWIILEELVYNFLLNLEDLLKKISTMMDFLSFKSEYFVVLKIWNQSFLFWLLHNNVCFLYLMCVFNINFSSTRWWFYFIRTRGDRWQRHHTGKKKGSRY